jgi:hypothetical protein
MMEMQIGKKKGAFEMEGYRIRVCFFKKVNFSG